MKILLASTGIQQRAGTYTTLKNICPLLRKSHEVTILTNEGDVDIEYDHLIQLKSTNFPIPNYYYMPGLADLPRKGSFDDYDIIHIFEYPIFVADFFTINKKSIKPPLIISAHGSIHQFSGFPFNIMKKIHNKFMLRYKNNISLFLASTVAEKNHLTEYGIPEEKIKVLPQGVSIQPIQRIKKTRKKVLYVGRLAKTKNLELLIEAAYLSKDKDFETIIAGPDFGMLPKLQKLAKKLKIEDRVHFLGQISEERKLQLFAEASVFVHPSLEDVFSLSLIEALSAGVPSVAFAVEANSEMIEDMITGVLVKENTALSLSETINSLLENEDNLEEISNNAAKITPKKYGWNITVEKLEQYYKDVLIN